MKVYVPEMEKKANFRECPKCGLRNKPSAVQCDFCGQSLNIDDDWQSHVKDLESLTRMELRKPMDDKVSRRIESTIIRKETTHNRGLEVKEVGNLEKILNDLDQTQPLKEIKVEERRERPRWVEPPEIVVSIREAPELEIGAEVPVQPAMVKKPEIEVSEKRTAVATEPAPEKTPETEASKVGEETSEAKAEEPPQAEGASPAEISPITEGEIVTTPEPVLAAPESVAEAAPLEGMPSPVEEPPVKEPVITVTTDSSASTIKLKLVQVEEPDPAKNDLVVPIVRPRRFILKGTKAMAALGLGIILYIVILVLVGIGALDSPLGLVGGAISSAIIIYGAAVTYPSLRHKDPDEVYICPKCHETVDPRKENCPACGAKFRSED